MVLNQFVSISTLLRGVLQQGPAPGAAPSLLTQLVPMLAIFAIFYFLLIAPSRKKQKKHEEMLGSLKKGDEIVTSGGIYGTVAAVEDRVVHLKISDQVKIKLEKGAVAALVSEQENPKE